MIFSHYILEVCYFIYTSPIVIVHIIICKFKCTIIFSFQETSPYQVI